jgi:alanyl-tRNA synthetase
MVPAQRCHVKQAEQIGAEMEFGAKYPDIVSVYYIGHDIRFCYFS